MAVNTCAFVFPGQGSQKVGMLAAAYDEFASKCVGWAKEVG